MGIHERKQREKEKKIVPPPSIPWRAQLNHKKASQKTLHQINNILVVWEQSNKPEKYQKKTQGFKCLDTKTMLLEYWD